MSAPDKIWMHPKEMWRVASEVEFIGAHEYTRSDLIPQWQPIESAPRDGTFIVFSPTRGVCCDVENWMNTEFECFFFEYGRIYDATHWQPLPAPPQRKPE